MAGVTLSAFGASPSAAEVAVAVDAPTAAEIATEVGAQAACAAALTAAAGVAVPSVVQIQSGLATAATLAPVAAAVVALTATAISHLGADAEVEVVAAIPGYTIVVWGYEAYQFSGTTYVEWRLSSGDAVENPGNVDVTKAGRIPMSGSRIFPPGIRALFSGQPSKALFSKKDTGIDITGTVWWTTIANP